jgi:hypothetical protein
MLLPENWDSGNEMKNVVILANAIALNNKIRLLVLTSNLMSSKLTLETGKSTC